MGNSEVVARLWREAPGLIDEPSLDWWAENGWSRDITWRAIEGAPDDVGLIEGPERLRRYYVEWIEIFEEIKVEARDVIDVGEKVVASIHVSARSRSSGMPVELDLGVVYDLDPTGRIAAGREYATRDEAVRAVEATDAEHESTTSR
jgi:ketosteroid isomerase-like protein